MAICLTAGAIFEMDCHTNLLGLSGELAGAMGESYKRDQDYSREDMSNLFKDAWNGVGEELKENADADESIRGIYEFIENSL